MKMNDSQQIMAPKEAVWAALNDPAVLRRCIPGCESLEMTSLTDMTAAVVVRVGPVKAKFGGKVTLSELNPPTSYRISGEGSGGVAGFAKGGALVQLESETEMVTILHYEVDAQIGGKLAQLGGRLIDSTSKRLANEFFAAFGETVANPSQDPAVEPPKKSWLNKLVGAASVLFADECCRWWHLLCDGTSPRWQRAHRRGDLPVHQLGAGPIQISAVWPVRPPGAKLPSSRFSGPKCTKTQRILILRCGTMRVRRFARALFDDHQFPALGSGYRLISSNETIYTCEQKNKKQS